MREQFKHLTKSIINTYGILFFSQNKVLGAVLFVVSFFNFAAGFSGLLGALFAIVFTTLTGYQKQDIEKGLYSFNTLLLGIGFGTFYHLNIAFFIWLSVGCLVCVLLTLTISSWLNKHTLPVLSFPFIISFWILLSASASIFRMGLEPKNSSILNELVSKDNTQVSSLVGLFYYVDLYFRALSAILFQNNFVAGLLISLGILIHSRIAFCASLLAFIVACLFNAISPTYPEGLSYYHLGSNFMMTAIGISSFFLVPSIRSYCWAAITVPIAFLLVNASTRIIGLHNLPILSLPFCMVTWMLLYFFKTKKTSVKTVLVVFQSYSPEKNLYQYLNSQERLNNFKYFNIQLPFLGKWFVSQAYNGDITHKRDWAQALDFVIRDEDYKTYNLTWTKPEHYYCFNKPVLACGDGVVEEIADEIEDNEIGQINTKDNWGNSIVIRHAIGLYSQVSHLKKNSVKVKIGDQVKQGDIIGLCGNSGRSPEPHLHLQLQATPYIGSKTLAYPFSNFKSDADLKKSCNSYTIPQENMTVSQLSINYVLKEAFSFQAGFAVKVLASDERSEIFEVQVDQFNQTYFHSKSTESFAYFINNGTAFYFTAFYGNKKSLLYLFYLAAYHIAFTDDPCNYATDAYPLHLFSKQLFGWIQDFLAPFYRFIKLNYESNNQTKNQDIAIYSKQYQEIFGQKKQTLDATIQVGGNNIQSFKVSLNGIKTEVKWVTENTF